MKILLVGAASSVHLVRWANAFVDRGHQVLLFTEHAPIDGFRPEVLVHRAPHLGGAGYFLNRGRLRRVIRSFAPDVINAHYASGYGTLAVQHPSIPLVLNVWGSDVYEFPDGGAVQRGLLRRNLRKAQAIISTSEVMARRTAEVCPGLGPITVVPFGVDTVRFAPRATTHTGLVIGTVKTLAPKYGIDTLIRAFAQLHAGHPSMPMQLRIVGGGADRAELEQLAARSGLTGIAEFLGPVPHERVPEELARMDIYVALSRTDSESFGVAIIEASACGLPVVVSDKGGLPEVVEAGVTGFVVPADDPSAAAEAMGRMIASPDLRDRMGKAGRTRVMEKYEWGGCVSAQLAVFEEVINAHRS